MKCQLVSHKLINLPELIDNASNWVVSCLPVCFHYQLTFRSLLSLFFLRFFVMKMTHFGEWIIWCFPASDTHYFCLLLRNENCVFVRGFEFFATPFPFLSLLHCYFYYSYVVYARRGFLFSLALTTVVCCRGSFLLQLLAVANLWPWLWFRFALLNPFHTTPVFLLSPDRNVCRQSVLNVFYFLSRLSLKFSLC